MKTLSYNISIKLCDAQMVISKSDDETEEEFDKRFKEAEGRFFLRAVVRDDNNGAPYHVALEGPYRRYDDPDVFMAVPVLMKAVAEVIEQREKSKG